MIPPVPLSPPPLPAPLKVRTAGSLGAGEPLTPGLHHGISAKAYHSDPCPEPSLSSGIARTILSDSIAHAHKAHPRLGAATKAQTEAMGLGSLVHSLMDDGVEKDYELGAFSDYKSGDARRWRDGVSASGKYPVLGRDLEDATPIAEALRKKAHLGGPNTPWHPEAKCEVTGIWKEGDVWCRARYDRLILGNAGADVYDWKTTNNITDRGIISSISKYGYHIQVAFYIRGLESCTGIDAGNIDFNLVFVEAAAPYTVRRVKLTDTFMAEGNRQAELAIEKWGSALKTGDWSDPREREVFSAEMPMWMDYDNIEISTG